MTQNVRFERKTLWHARGKNFLVEVMHREVEDMDYRAPNRWNVYAYIYPGHPRFDKITPPASSLYPPPGTDGLHFHGGILGAVTLFRVHRGDDGSITSYQFGSDYNHLHDDWARETRCPNEGETNGIFRDAEKLFDQLSGADTTTEVKE